MSIVVFIFIFILVLGLPTFLGGMLAYILYSKRKQYEKDIQDELNNFGRKK